ncbi:MAG: 2,4-dienoyl-CoA reductase, partial [Pseudonocardia sp.]|nr:2,4-dienoyl-CoA reductase [Pseudonocardia sp.]
MLFGPHVTNLGVRRSISARHVAYYARRAAGGAGVVVTEVASVHGSDWPYERAPLAVDCVDGWAAVARACGPALVLAGLGHAGAQGSSAYGQQALWAPSRVPDVASREVPMEMEQPEIDALVAGFASAAALAARAGCDGVEIDAGQHSLLRQFLSGLTNHRADAHGEDRALLLRLVLAAVRAAIGDGVLGLRLCCDELAPWAGITPDSAIATARAVAAWTDYLVPVRGSGMSVSATRPDLHTAPGFNALLCTPIRPAVGVADGCAEQRVVLQGSVGDPAAAQTALDDGVCDLVEMTRAQITDPDLVAHVRAGTPERIRPCTLSNQRSQVRDPRNPIVSDEAEPDAGHETEVEEPPPGTLRDVLV